jgi:hypothetical protein
MNLPAKTWEAIDTTARCESALKSPVFRRLHYFWVSDGINMNDSSKIPIYNQSTLLLDICHLLLKKVIVRHGD